MNKEFYQRELLPEVKKLFHRKEIFAIKGPRQAGKTTLLKMIAEWLEKEASGKVEFVTFEDMEELEKFSVDPKQLIKSRIQGKGKNYFLLDEFHYVKDGGRKLKLLYDTMENVKFVVTGSSSLELGTLSRYLVGRLFSFYLFPFSFHERLLAKDKRLATAYVEKSRKARNFILEGKDFTQARDIFLKDMERMHEQHIIWGGYPEAVKEGEEDVRRIILKNIYETYVAKDVVTLLRIEDVFKFRKLVALLSSQVGGMVNYNELSSSTGGYYKDTVKTLNSLEETYVIRLVRPFHKNLRTELKKNPKIYFIDTGLRNYISNNFNPIETRSDRGSLAENAVFNSLFQMTKDFGKINYWRTLAKAEVDFVLTLGEESIPIEVKFTSMNKPKVSRSLNSFISHYRPSRAIVVTKSFWGESSAGETKVKFIPACYL